MVNVSTVRVYQLDADVWMQTSHGLSNDAIRNEQKANVHLERRARLLLERSYMHKCSGFVC